MLWTIRQYQKTGGDKMSYFNHSDYNLCYNPNSVRGNISDIKNILGTLKNKINETVSDIENLEMNAHDVPQTKVDNDYKCIEKIFDEYGLNSSISKIESVLNNLSSDMSSYESAVHENQERRRREEERQREEEERRRRLESFRL